MTPRSMKLVTITFFGLSAALLINLLSLQPTSSVRLAGRGSDRASTPSLTVAAESDSDGKGRVRVAPREAASERKPGLAPARTINLATSEPTASAGDGPETIRAVQRELQARGYEAGTVDGVPGLVTRAAVLAYEFDHGLSLSAEPSERLLKQILLGESQPSANPGSGNGEHTAQAEQVIRTVQQSLANVGYAVGKTDGRMGEETVRAIREFETDQGMPETGRVSGHLVARLARLAGQGRLTASR